MPIPRFAYEALCRLYGEAFVSRFYTPVNVISGYQRPRRMTDRR